MARAPWVTKGLKEYLERLQNVVEAEKMVKQALYVGADVVADTIRAKVEGLPTSTGRYSEKHHADVLTPPEKAGLLEGLGVSKMRNDIDKINVKIGFNGYNNQHTKRFSNGQPNQLIARAVCSGSSVRNKNNFMAAAMRESREPAIEAMKAKFEQVFDKQQKGL